MVKKKIKVKILFYQTYLRLIKNSAGSCLFRDLFALVNGQKRNITEGGRLSCAFYVSAILRIFGLINKLCPTVNGLIRELKKSGWREIKKPKPGSVIIWVAKKFSDGSIHKHAGFYLGENKAVSNGVKRRYPIFHHWTYGRSNGKPKRQIEAIFWRSGLDRWA